MSNAAVIFFLSLGMALLIGIILYQQFVFRTGIQDKLAEISGSLKKILDQNSGEGIMVFTENRELMKLAAQINRLLETHRKTMVDYRRFEIASKKMLSNISHDIKTPMTVVLGYLEIIRLDGTNTDEMLQKVEQKAQVVMDLINEFFTLAKLESGDMEIELSALNINEICRENVLDFYEILTKNQFQVDVNIPDVAIYVQGNKEALQRILFNLLSNAIRYGADGRYLGITLREDEKSLLIDVTDKGKGIDKIFEEHVFDRLFTMEDSRNRKIQGNGLGLTIAQNLARRLGGEITLQSIPDVETTFTVRLKKYPAKTAAKEICKIDSRV